MYVIVIVIRVICVCVYYTLPLSLSPTLSLSSKFDAVFSARRQSVLRARNTLVRKVGAPCRICGTALLRLYYGSIKALLRLY